MAKKRTPSSKDMADSPERLRARTDKCGDVMHGWALWNHKKGSKPHGHEAVRGIR